MKEFFNKLAIILILKTVEIFFAHWGIYEFILLGVLFIAFLIQVIYYLYFFVQVPLYKGRKMTYSEPIEPVSVVICAKNEAENLMKNLPAILEQEYPNYEVVVVNDCSDDDSQDILEEFQKRYPHLRVSQIKHDEKFTHGKKLALTIGIKAAKNEWILFSDADCKPEGQNWIMSMQRNFVSSKQIVLGYGGYYAEKGFLNKIIRFDTFFIALQYFSFAIRKIPYMGVGRNLAYRKSLFMQHKGFASHAHILSGDDDLFVNEAATQTNTVVEVSPRSHTRSVPKRTFNLWAAQKRRHLSTGPHYKKKHKILLAGEVSSRLLFYLIVLLLLIDRHTWILGLGALVLRMIIQMTVLKSALKKLNEKKLLFFSIIFDIILPLMNIYWYVSNLINTKPHRWK